jgi:TatD DNase family protein
MTRWTDTHAHIYLQEFDADREEVLERARRAGLGKILMPNIDDRSVEAMLEVESRYPDMCCAMMGLHPCSVREHVQRQLYQIEEWLNKRPFVAIGEMGTDRYWDTTYWDQQVEAFRIQAGFARKYRLPMVIHCRNSLDETLDLLDELQDGTLKGVFHCFTGSRLQADRIMQLGYYVGIGGVATFKNGGLEQVIPHVPLDRIVLETDSPYLAPAPYRGKRNEPAYLLQVATRLADCLRLDLNEFQEITHRNVQQLFPHVYQQDHPHQ